MKKHFLLIVTLLLISLVSTALADNETDKKPYTINISSMVNEIKMDETARFLVYISGEFNQTTRFKIYSPAVEWDIPEDFIDVSPVDQEASHILEIKPLHISSAGVYGIPLHIRNENTDELTKKTVYISLKTGIVTTGMNPSVRIDINMPDNVNPKETLDVKIDFINKNLLNLTDLRFEITSSLEEIATRQDIDDLKPLGKNSVEFQYMLDPDEPAGENTLTIDLYQIDKVIKSGTKKFNIIALTPPFLESVSVDSFLLKTKKQIEYISESNIEDIQTVRVQTTWLEDLFTTTNKEVDVITEEGKKYFTFDLELAPKQTETVTIVTNYRIIAYIIIIIILISIFYLKTKSPLVIKKSLNQTGTEEGGVSEIKIMLEINNRSKKDVKNVTIRDPIPNLVEVKKEFAEGTLKPSKYLRGKDKGMVLEWEIDELAAGENRLIGYNIKSRLSIIGSFKLPRARISFIKKGKEQTAYSNSVSVGV